MTRFAMTLTATSILAMAAGGAIAQTDSESGTDAHLETSETSLEQAGESLENAAEATGDAAQSAVSATVDAAKNAAKATQEEIGEATMPGDENPGAIVSAVDMANVVRARNLIGGELYSTSESSESWDSGDGSVSMGEDYSDLGEIEDVLFDHDGQLVGIVAEVGGFLDIGDKHIVLASDEFRIGREEDEYFVVVNMTEEDLEMRESVDTALWR